MSVTTTEAPAPVEPRPPGPGMEAAADRAASRRGLLLALPGYAYLVIFFAIPLVIVLVYSFGTRSPSGRTILGQWNLDSYARLAQPLIVTIFWRSLWLAVVSTVICLLMAYPFAYYLATRSPRVRNALLVLVMIPFWTNFLVRTYAWRMILGSDGPAAVLSRAIGWGDVRILFTDWAILIGLVYGFLPFMVLPLYAALERMDWSLVEAARDLYASGWEAFRHVTLPLSKPGIIAGSILVFIPGFGAFVTPALLGGGRTMLGSFIFNQFLAARDWPFGSAISMVMMAVMLGATLLYFRTGGKTL